MHQLSSAFREAFHAASNLQALHLGFPVRAPLSLPMEDLFHNIKWEKLKAFGVQSWRLSTEEILAFACRHQKTLKGLRLRDVLLKEDCMWKDVLKVLRADMMQLEWLSLRRADYTANFDAGHADGVDLTNDELLSSDSDESEWEAAHNDDGDSDSLEIYSDAGTESSDSESGGDDDHGPGTHSMALKSDTPGYCTCGRRGSISDAEDLGDNGIYVTRQRRKMWEQWVIGRCLEHSKAPA